MSKTIANITPSDYYIASPVGEMKYIQELQIKLAAKITWLTKSFGKAYKEQREGKDGYRPEIYIGGNEYLDVFPDDGVTSLCFFDVDEEFDAIANSGQTTFETTVRIVFFVNLPLAYPLLTTRADAEVRQDVIDLIMFYRHRWEITRVLTGVQNVYSTYNWDLPEAQIDKQPYHVFSIETRLVFDNYKKCT